MNTGIEVIEIFRSAKQGEDLSLASNGKCYSM
jgi:hypothetical protein